MIRLSITPDRRLVKNDIEVEENLESLEALLGNYLSILQSTAISIQDESRVWQIASTIPITRHRLLKTATNIMNDAIPTAYPMVINQ